MKIILASKSGVRKEILDKYNIDNEVIVSNVDEEEIKESLLNEGADPLSISKNLAEIKSIKVSNRNPDRYVLGADSVISLNKELINKPSSREEALSILKKLSYDSPSIYTDTISIEYQNFRKLLNDIKEMNISYCYKDKRETFENKKYFKTLENFYREKYFKENYILDIKVNIISAWKK